MTSGSLPSGLSLDGSSGIISGTPTASGSSHFTVTATDSSNPAQTASASESITIDAAPVGKASTSTRLTLTGSPAAFGHEKTVVFTATVSPQFSGTPAGTITVKSGTATLCSGTLAAGSMSCSPGSASALAPGSTP